jgi:putative nucleotidyltransferase with HDIG domain
VRTPAEIIRDVDQLPTLPTVVARITELVEDPRSSAADINELIAKDVALSSRILKLVNSSFYGFPRKISTITHAVVILGFNTVRTLTLSAFVFDAFKARNLAFGYKDFWVHCVGTAVASSNIAKRLGAVDTEPAFLCGLLHDIGKLVLHQYATDDFRQVLDRVREKDCLIYTAEMDLLGVSHAEFGALLLEKWKLPAPMVEVIRNHHSPALDQTPERLTCVVHLADILVRSMYLGHAGDRQIPALDPSACQRMGIGENDFAEMLESLQKDMHRVHAFIEML